jgi:hypothetical protein
MIHSKLLLPGNTQKHCPFNIERHIDWLTASGIESVCDNSPRARWKFTVDAFEFLKVQHYIIKAVVHVSSIIDGNCAETLI